METYQNSSGKMSGHCDDPCRCVCVCEFRSCMSVCVSEWVSVCVSEIVWLCGCMAVWSGGARACGGGLRSFIINVQLQGSKHPTRINIHNSDRAIYLVVSYIGGPAVPYENETSALVPNAHEHEHAVNQRSSAETGGMGEAILSNNLASTCRRLQCDI
jgi:hypothetical protein